MEEGGAEAGDCVGAGLVEAVGAKVGAALGRVLVEALAGATALGPVVAASNGATVAVPAAPLPGSGPPVSGGASPASSAQAHVGLG